MDTYYPLSQIPANKLERIESGDNHGIEEVRVGKSKECMHGYCQWQQSNVSGARKSLGTLWVLYQVLCEVLQTVKPCVNALEIMLSAQAVMSSVQLPPHAMMYAKLAKRSPCHSPQSSIYKAEAAAVVWLVRPWPIHFSAGRWSCSQTASAPTCC